MKPDSGISVAPASDALPTKQHILNSLLWFANNFHWGALVITLLPDDIEKIVPDHKAVWLGIVAGIGAIPAIIVPLISGALSDRSQHPKGRRRPFIVVGTIINIIGLMLMGFSAQIGAKQPSMIYAYLVAFLVVQVGNNIALGAYMGLIPDTVPKSDRGRASGFMALFSQLGTLLGALAVGMFLGGASPVLKYGIVAAQLGIVTYIMWKSVHETQHFEPNQAPWNLRQYMRSLWINPKQFPDFAWVWITRFAVMAGFYSIQSFIKYYIGDLLGVPHDQVSGEAPKILGVILIFSSISAIIGGKLSDRYGRKRVVYIANGLIAVVAPLFIFCQSVPAALAIGAVFGIGYGAYISVDYALGTDVLPNPDDAGRDMAVWHIAMTLPQTIFIPIAGFMLAIPGKSTEVVGTETVTHYTQTGYAIIFVMASVCFALGAIGLKNVRGVK